MDVQKFKELAGEVNDAKARVIAAGEAFEAAEVEQRSALDAERAAYRAFTAFVRTQAGFRSEPGGLP